MHIIIVTILLFISSTAAYAQLISHQNWQNATVASDAILVSCASLLLPFELGRTLIENTPTTTRGEMDISLRSGHPIKVSLQPQSGTADTISSITGCTTNGARIQLATVDVGDSITIAHTPGAIEFVGGTSVVLDNPLKILTLQRKSGIWVADGGLGAASGGTGVLENLTTACAIGEVGTSDGAGQVNCGPSIVQQSECSTVIGVGALCIDINDGHVYRGNGTGAHRMSSVFNDDDCAPYVAIGALCIDTNDGLVYRGDGDEAIVIGATAATQTLQDAFSLGKVISGANSQANAFVVGNGTDGFRFYNNIMECFQGASDCDIVLDIPTGKSLRIKYNGTEGIVFDSNGIGTFNNNMLVHKSYWFSAGSLSVDGVHCTDPVERTINGGPRLWTLKCADNVAATFYGSVTPPDSYNGGPLFFTLVAENENAPPSGNLVLNFSAMCRSDSDPIDAVWGAVGAVTMAMNTQFDVEQQWTAIVTPNGTCAAGDTVFWRAVVNDTLTTTQAANTYILGVRMKYPTNKWSD